MWINPLNELIKWINTEDLAVIETGVNLFTIIFSEMDNTISSIVP